MFENVKKNILPILLKKLSITFDWSLKFSNGLLKR